jgi:hypothetical protein
MVMEVGVAKIEIAPNAHVAARKRNTQAMKRTTSSCGESTCATVVGGGFGGENFGFGVVVDVVGGGDLCVERASKFAVTDQATYGGHISGLLSSFAYVMEQPAGREVTFCSECIPFIFRHRHTGVSESATGFSPPRGGACFVDILLINIGKRQRVFKDPQTVWGTRVHG